MANVLAEKRGLDVQKLHVVGPDPSWDLATRSLSTDQYHTKNLQTTTTMLVTTMLVTRIGGWVGGRDTGQCQIVVPGADRQVDPITPTYR